MVDGSVGVMAPLGDRIRRDQEFKPGDHQIGRFGVTGMALDNPFFIALNDGIKAVTGKDGNSASGFPAAVRRWPSTGGRGEEHPDPGSLARFTLDHHLALVSLHCAVDHGQPQPGAFARLLGGEEGV